MHLSYNGGSKVLPVDDEFWPKLMSGGHGLDDGALLSRGEVAADWTQWEMHPAGDEIVMLLSGKVDFVLAVDDTDKVVSLEGPLSFVVVPAGVWHTVRVHEPGEAVFITPGRGTQHRPL